MKGIEQVLSELKRPGKLLALATSKPETRAVRILQHFHLMKYFDETVGSELDGTRNDKAEVIRERLCGVLIFPKRNTGMSLW